MLSPLKNFFHYSRGERRGVFLLLIILLLLISWYFIRSYFDVSYKESDFSKFDEKIKAFQESKVENDESLFGDSLFLFNPNTIEVEEWILLGFSDKQAQSIENYKNSGATFKIKKDLLKLFMVDESIYKVLEPYIDLPDQVDYVSTDYHNNYEYKSEHTLSNQYIIVLTKSDNPIYEGFDEMGDVYYSKRDSKYWYVLLGFEDKNKAESYADSLHLSGYSVEQINSVNGFYPIKSKTTFSNNNQIEEIIVLLNTCDTTELKTLKGIGSSFAKRIVKYRDLLGGFHQIQQLTEVYGLSPETINQNEHLLKLDVNDIKKININKASVEDLKAHPYIKWSIANSIVQIRNNYGNFAAVDGIKKSDLINEELFLKIAPYLTVE